MGYTHYWSHDKAIEDDVWNKIAKEAMVVARKSSARIQYEYDDESLPCFDSQQVRFNGVDDEGHETFQLTPDPISFAFCKTAVKPYDTIVVAILIIAKHHCPSFSWRSDGEPQEMQDSLDLLRSCSLPYVVNMEGCEDNLLEHDDEPEFSLEHMS